MAKFQVWVKAEIELDIEADNYQEAQEIAEDIWYDRLKHSGDFEIDDMYCYKE